MRYQKQIVMNGQPSTGKNNMMRYQKQIIMNGQPSTGKKQRDALSKANCNERLAQYWKKNNMMRYQKQIVMNGYSPY